MAHLFEPFNRLGHAGLAIEGSGLGLGLVRALWYVEKMGSRIEVQSVKGECSTFTVVLPAAAAPGPAAVPAAPAAAPYRPAA